MSKRKHDEEGAAVAAGWQDLLQPLLEELLKRLLAHLFNQPQAESDDDELAAKLEECVDAAPEHEHRPGGRAAAVKPCIAALRAHDWATVKSTSRDCLSSL